MQCTLIGELMHIKGTFAAELLDYPGKSLVIDFSRFSVHRNGEQMNKSMDFNDNNNNRIKGAPQGWITLPHSDRQELGQGGSVGLHTARSLNPPLFSKGLKHLLAV